MSSMQTSTTLLGVVLALLILYLVRRGRLYVMHSLSWMLLSVGAVVLGAWPGLIDTLASWLGFAYPPAFLLLLACSLLLLKALHADLLSTRLECDIRRLNQRLALLELQLQPAGEGTAGAAQAASAEHAPGASPAPHAAPGRV